MLDVLTAFGLNGLWLADGAQEVTQIRWEQAPEAWQTFLIILLVLAFSAASYLLEPKADKTSQAAAKWGLAFVRTVIILLAVAVLFQPIESKELVEEKDGYVLVAIDTSRSMEFKDREKDEGLRREIASAIGMSPERLRDTSRLSRVQAALAHESGTFLRELADKNRLRVYAFDANRRRVGGSDLDKRAEDMNAEDQAEATLALRAAVDSIDGLAPDGQSTALGDSLQRILTDVRADSVAALILLSDGRSNSGSLSAEAVAARFGRKGIPIYAIGVGDPDPPRNLILDTLWAPEVSLAGDLIEGSLRLQAQGYDEPREVKVIVRLDNEVIHEQLVLIGGDRPEERVDFSTKIDEPGEYRLEAEVEPDPDELTDKDNRDFVTVRVIDERIKVLYIDGAPRWEYRYLKNALIRDHRMEVQCYLLSADQSFIQEHSEGMPPLRGVPSPQELLDYHVVILGEVNPLAIHRGTGEPVFEEGTWEALRTLVKDRGGGLLMVSGDTYSPRHYKGTPVADILPVVIDEASPQRRDFTRPFRMRLTREGYESTMIRLEHDDPRLNRELWDSTLRGLYWYSQVLRPKPQAHVLAYHPSERNSHGNYPLLAWHRYGAGTCFWSGIDETWRWRAEVGDKYPYRFYTQIIRFLSLQSFTKQKRFVVTTDKDAYDVGDEVRVRAEIRGRDGDTPGAAEQTSQEVLMDLPDGSRQTLSLAAIEGEAGKFEGVFKPIQIGRYDLTIDPKDEGSSDEVAGTDFTVKLPRLELQDPRMDQETLERVALASEGKFMRLNELSDIPDDFEPLTEVVSLGKNEKQLWDRKELLYLFLLLLACEWIGRKIIRLL